MILRQIARELAATANEFPVVTIIGPRQAGKTTLARMQFPNHAYANLEAPDIRLLALRSCFKIIVSPETEVKN